MLKSNNKENNNKEIYVKRVSAGRGGSVENCTLVHVGRGRLKSLRINADSPCNRLRLALLSFLIIYHPANQA